MSAPTAAPTAEDELCTFLPRPTLTLRALVRQYERDLSPADLAAVLAHLRELAAAYEAELTAAPAGTPRARALHARIEAEMRDLTGETPRCARGCAACCHLEVQITSDEASELAELVAAGHPIDHARLARLATRAPRDPAWGEHLSRENRCLFLGEDDACTVYEARPGACRKLLVTSSPYECFRRGGAPVAVLVPRVDVLLSVAIGLPGAEPAAIPRALAAALARRAAG